jgi:hypothetical protein
MTQLTKTQTSKTIKELNDIISLRNHIYMLVNGPRTSLIARDEENKLRMFASQLDREVVDKSLEMVILPEDTKPALKAETKPVKAKVAKKETEDPKPKGTFRRVE